MVISAVLTSSGKWEIQVVYNMTKCRRGWCRKELVDEEFHPAKSGACGSYVKRSPKPKFVLFD